MNFPNHLGRLLRETAARYPDRLAVTVAGAEYTYRVLHEYADKLARGFTFSSGKYCALLGARSFAMLAGVVAALGYDKTYLPLNEDDQLERLSLVANASRYDLLICCGCELALFGGLLVNVRTPLTVILADARQLPDWCAEYPRHRFLSLAELDRLPVMEAAVDNPDAYLMFTSGSTGIPKGVQVSHTNVIHYLESTVALYRPTVEDRFSQLAPLSFDFSVHDLFVPWAVGASTHVFDANHGFTLDRYIQGLRLTFWASVPSTALYMQRLRLLEPGTFTSLRQTLFCGEPLLHDIAADWSRAAPRSCIDNIYGPTEATVAVCGFRWRPGAASSSVAIVPIGSPYPGTLLSIGRPWQEGDQDEGRSADEGELWIGGAQVVAGYWSGMPAGADNFLVDNGRYWYRTGDWVKQDAAGVLHFLGRCDDQLQVRGQRLERLELECMLRQVSGEGDVAVVGWPVIEGNSVGGLAFFVATHEQSAFNLRKLCQKRMPRAMWPTQLLLGHIPKNRNGKTDYKMLKARLAAGEEVAASAFNPESE